MRLSTFSTPLRRDPEQVFSPDPHGRKKRIGNSLIAEIANSTPRGLEFAYVGEFQGRVHKNGFRVHELWDWDSSFDENIGSFDGDLEVKIL